MQHFKTAQMHNRKKVSGAHRIQLLNVPGCDEVEARQSSWKVEEHCCHEAEMVEGIQLRT